MLESLDWTCDSSVLPGAEKGGEKSGLVNMAAVCKSSVYDDGMLELSEVSIVSQYKSII